MTQRAGRTILLVGDVHNHTERLARSLSLAADAAPDLVLLTGDIGVDPPWHRAQRRTQRERHDESVRAVIEQVRSSCACPVAFVPGNHDLDDPPADVAGINVDRKWVEVAGLVIAGFGGAGPTRFGFPYEWSEEEADLVLAERFDDAPAIDIFLSHSPPFNSMLDRTAHGVAVGSRAVRRRLVIVRPKLFVCGHIHEAWGRQVVEGVPCVNAGAIGEPYGGELVWVVNWKRGPERIRSVTRDAAGSVAERDWPS